MAVLPGSLRFVPPFPFAGRSRELGELRALLPRAAGEGSRVALLAGEAGAGKSRLVRELAQHLAGEGALVLYGACDVVVRTPYGAVVEALEPLARSRKELELDAVLQAGSAELGRLLPNLVTGLAAPAPDPMRDPDTERHRLHGAVVELLGAASTRQPLLLLLDDLHWADVPTLLLVRHLVRSGSDARMLLVATFRDTERDAPPELSETLADLRRVEGVVRMRLTGLSGGEIAEFVRLAAGVDAAGEVAEAIGELTEGNPFLVTELWRELIDSEVVEVGPAGVQLVRPLDSIGTPESVREVVSMRLARLRPATTELLELAAVVGSEFELDTLRRASGLGEGMLLEALEEAVQSGMIVELPARRIVYGFTHELVRRALSDRLAAPRRAQLHLRVGEAIERASAQHGGQHLGDLAHHFAVAAPVGGAERAIAYNLGAARAASAGLAFDEAVERFRVALDVGVDDVRERARVLLELGDAARKAGRSAEALAAFAESAGLARALEERELLALAAIGFEEACWRPGIADAGAAELLEEAAGAEGLRLDLRVRLLGGLARALDFRGERGQGALARDEAIRLAREHGDRRGLATVLAAAYWSRGTSTIEEILEMLLEAREIGTELGNAELQAETVSWLVPTFVAIGDHEAARRELAELFGRAGRTSEPFRLHVAEHYASALALCDGDLGAAEAAAQRSHEWGRLLTGRDASGVHGIQMFGIRREQGRLAEVAPLVRLLAADDRPGIWGPGFVVLLAELDMEGEARRALRRVAAAGLDELRPSLWLAALVYLADACGMLRDPDVAAVVYEALEPYEGSNVMVGHLVACYGAADRYLGTLAAQLGEWERAESYFEAALALDRRLGARTWLAHTAFEYAQMLLARRAVGDRAAAMTLLGEATALADAVGLRALSGRIARLGLSVTPSPPLPDGLSAREVEILRQVARGLSNREIGRELTISEHTAANHVRSILRKTGCANRTEAAAYAHRHGLALG